MIRAVIFDFNGVLVDDEQVHFELFREVLEAEGVVISARDYHERYLGYDDRGCFEVALGDAGQSFDRSRIDDLIARKAARYVAVAESGLRFFPGAAGCLAALAERWPLAIYSGALRPEIEFALRRMSRRDRVAAIISAEDTTRCKPDPQGYLLALDALRSLRGAELRDLKPEHCLVIEDSLAGISSAKGAGMWAVGILHTYGAEALRDAGADALIEGLEELTPRWIDSHFGTGDSPQRHKEHKEEKIY
jgi:HAD superfamily hydrolase (TIGR01509 family)